MHSISNFHKRIRKILITTFQPSFIIYVSRSHREEPRLKMMDSRLVRTRRLICKWAPTHLRPARLLSHVPSFVFLSLAVYISPRWAAAMKWWASIARGDSRSILQRTQLEERAAAVRVSVRFSSRETRHFGGILWPLFKRLTTRFFSEDIAW